MMVLPIAVGEPSPRPTDDHQDAPEGTFLALLASQVADQHVAAQVRADSDGADALPAAPPTAAPPPDMLSIAGALAPDDDTATPGEPRRHDRGVGSDAIPGHRVVGLARLSEAPAPGRHVRPFMDPAGPVNSEVEEASSSRTAMRLDVPPSGDSRRGPPPASERYTGLPDSAPDGRLGAEVSAVASATRTPGKVAPAVLSVLRGDSRDGALSVGVDGPAAGTERALDAAAPVAPGVEALGEAFGRTATVSTGQARVVDPAILDRVLRAVEALEHAPPPRQMSIEVEGIRLTIGLQGDEVRVVVRAGADQLAPDWHRELAGLLRGRGLDLAADTNSGRGASGRGDGRPGGPASPVSEGEPVRARPAPLTDDLHL